MGERQGRTVSGWAFAAAVAGVGALVAAQSATHLFVVLHLGRIGSLVDLDRSNGIPDVISTVALVAAVGGAIFVARRCDGRERVTAAALAGLLAALSVADALHDGPHPSAGGGWWVISLVVATGVLLVRVGMESGLRPRVTLGVAAVILLASFLVNGLDRADQWFERARGDPIGEYQIVAKEGLELLGWSLVALALWDEAFRRGG